MPAPRLHAVLTGRARLHGDPHATDPLRRPWRSAYYKEMVAGPVRAEALGLVGDEQADRRVHGGVHQAVLAYTLDHYPAWRAELGIAEMGPGGFGENFSVEGLDEHTVRLGDVWRVGTARFRVTTHRGPCNNIALRWQRADMVKRVTETLRMGWYLAVIQPGSVEAGMPIMIESQGDPRWTVARVFQLWIAPASDPDAAAALAQADALPPDARAELRRRASARAR